MVHERQHNFFRYVAQEGHDVMLVSPYSWGSLKIDAKDETGKLIDIKPPFSLKSIRESFVIHALPVATGENDMYRYDMVGLEKSILGFNPDVLYVQQELECRVTQKCIRIAKSAKIPVVVFVWENLRPLNGEALATIRDIDLIIAGNNDAGKIHAAANRIVYLPQVGVDIAHFWARPEIARDISVGYVGRQAPEKGINHLVAAWPTAKVAPWKSWRELPWVYSHIRVQVAFSQDTPFWKEQAMPYAAAEAVSSECRVVVSDAGAIPYWLGGGFSNGVSCPGVKIVPQKDVNELRRAILDSLDGWEVNTSGREWMRKYLSSSAIASRLVGVLSTVTNAR